MSAFTSVGKGNLKVLILGESDIILDRNIDDFRYYHCVNFIGVEILGKQIAGTR